MGYGVFIGWIWRVESEDWRLGHVMRFGFEFGGGLDFICLSVSHVVMLLELIDDLS